MQIRRETKERSIRPGLTSRGSSDKECSNLRRDTEFVVEIPVNREECQLKNLPRRSDVMTSPRYIYRDVKKKRKKGRGCARDAEKNDYRATIKGDSRSFAARGCGH